MRIKESAWVLGQRLVLYDVDDVFSASAPEVKVAMINIFITRVGHMCNVRGIAHSNKPTGNYQAALPSPSALCSFIASFSSRFYFFLSHNLSCLTV